MTDIALLLKIEFEKRKSRNPSYSMRAFSKNLGMSPGSLCSIMSGKRIVGVKVAKRLEERLGGVSLVEDTQKKSTQKRMLNKRIKYLQQISATNDPLAEIVRHIISKLKIVKTASIDELIKDTSFNIEETYSVSFSLLSLGILDVETNSTTTKPIFSLPEPNP